MRGKPGRRSFWAMRRKARRSVDGNDDYVNDSVDEPGADDSVIEPVDVIELFAFGFFISSECLSNFFR